MPKSGQQWDPEFLARSHLLRVFDSLAERLRPADDWPSLEQYTQLAEARRAECCPDARTVSFAPATPKRARVRRDTPIDPARLYDGRIAVQGEVACLQASYHDWFNALAWAAFPRAKRAVHERQYRALTRWLPPGASRLPNRRTREQDALTVFDEGGAALVVRSVDELPAKSGGTDLETLAGRATLVVFGHAVMEHLAFESCAVRVAALVLETEEEPATGLALLDWVDQTLERRLRDPGLFQTPQADRVVVLQPPNTALI